MPLDPLTRPLSVETQRAYQKRFPLMRRFYMDGRGQLFGVQLRAAGSSVRRLVLLKLNPKTQKKELVASARMQLLSKQSELFLFKVHRGKKFPQNPVAPPTKGIGFFRVLMNEAIQVAKKHHLESIALEASPPKLQKYYGSYGFVAKRKPRDNGLQMFVWKPVLRKAKPRHR